MSIVSDIIATIIKTSVGNLTENELIKELMNILTDDISQKGIDEIVNFIIRQKTKITHILSSKNMKLLNISDEKIEFISFELKEFLLNIDISDKIFIQCKYNEKKLEEFLWKSYYNYKKGIIECESEIKKILGLVSNEILNLKRECVKFNQNVLIHIDNTVCDINEEIKQIHKFMENEIDKLGYHNQIIEEIINENISKNNTIIMKKCRTYEYIKKWNENMFLNNFDKRDKNAGINIKLKDLYLEFHLPHYTWKDNDEIWKDLKILLSEYINVNNKRMLLILGQPGIGKSTLITWISTNFIVKNEDILVYQFASDLQNIYWQNISKEYNLTEEILRELNLSYAYLEGKILILDGFDEINVGNDRLKILNELYWQLIQENFLNNFSLIITCRENYIQDLKRIKSDYITLQPWDKEQIKSFCIVYQNITKSNVSEKTISNILKNEEILGIPLILYMVLALNISIDREGSIVDVYDQIFSLNGGIYDRCIKNVSFASPHRINQIKKQIHQISREIAIWMFENNSEEACIPQKEYEEICNNIVQIQNNNIKYDFLIGNYFKLVKHCEGMETEELYFVHRSIYEYFVAETIYNSIENVIEEFTIENQEKLAENIAIYLKKGQITNTIGNYLSRKILYLYYKNKVERKRGYQWWEWTVERMMNYGMFYFTRKNIQLYKNIIRMESQCFLNLLQILRMLIHKKEKYIMIHVDSKQIEKYIRYCTLEYIVIQKEKRFGEFNLSNMYLHGINLSEVNLSEVNLSKSCCSKANLSKTDLSRAIMSEADLSGAYLIKADLIETDLSNVDLTDANLKGANLCGADLSQVILNGANLDFSIWLKEDIMDIYEQLKTANFEYIIIEHQNEQKRLYRNQLFPDE